jgi:hypothetical protein
MLRLAVIPFPGRRTQRAVETPPPLPFLALLGAAPGGDAGAAPMETDGGPQ